MGMVKLYSRALQGIEAPEVIVEVHVANGLPAFSIVGLPDIEVKESRDRVRSAIQMSGFEFPARRITVNLAPADLPKDSGRYDLPIAIGVLLASGLVKTKHKLESFEFAGELALDGDLRKVNGIISILYHVRLSKRHFIIPFANSKEASLVEGINIFTAHNLKEVIAYLRGEKDLVNVETCTFKQSIEDTTGLNFNQVKGQIVVKRALEIAASGRHSILLVGSPGCGKSMLASRLNTILPPLNVEQALSNASIQSLAGNEFKLENWGKVPFRQPHHSSSKAAMIGGGSIPKPGEISLAHNGVLFLDEILEFDRGVLEVLREPLETKKINLARARYKVEYPADFQLIGAMNPCPCGSFEHPHRLCRCSPEQVQRYTAKLSEPLLDRIDLVVQMPYIKTSDLERFASGDDSSVIKERVIRARRRQINRQGKLNYQLSGQEVELYCILEPEAKQLLFKLSEKVGLSVRAYYKLLRVAQTIADMTSKVKISAVHIAQSMQYRKTF